MSNIPKLRFPEFSGEWEKSELGKLTQEITRVNPNSDAPIMMISAANGFILQSNKYSKEMTGQSLKKYIELHAGEFAYNHGASKLKKYGACFCLDLDKARIPFVYHCFKLTEGNTKFFSYLLNRTQLDSELARYISSSARMDGLLNISYTDYMKINISVPTLAEQQKIANFLSNVDSIITAETKILNTLQKKKKALMQKLFTQQLRFKSDDGKDFPAWEEKKLGDVCSVLSGKRVPKGNKLTSVNTGLKYITVSDMGDKFVSNKDIKYITQEIETKIKKYKVITGDIIISVAGTLGKVNIITEEFNNANLTENCDKLTEFKGCITEYLFYFLQSEKFLDEINRIKTSSAQPKLALDRLRIFVIPIPIIEEQQKIADCLSSLDSLIQTQQKVVTTWQQRKKALLQQMFI